MGANIRSELENVMLGPTADPVGRQSTLEKWPGREIRGSAGFLAVRREVIRPTMREFADLLEERQVGSRISIDDPKGAKNGPSLSMTLRVFVRCALADPLADVPHYTARWDPDRDVVHLGMSNHTRHYGGTWQDDGSYMLAELSINVLEKKLLGFMSWILR